MSWVVGASDDVSTRQGQTVVSRVTFKPGLNSIIVAIARTALHPQTDAAAIRYAADYFADLLDVEPKYIGKDPMTAKGQVYNIGLARPVYVHPIGVTEKRMAWYKKLGSPVGDDVVFIALNLEWRGSTQTFEAPVGNVAIPSNPSVIQSQWPDGTSEEQKKRLQREANAKLTSHLGGEAEKYYESAKVVADRGQKALKQFEEFTMNRLIPELLPGAGWKMNAALIGLGVVGALGVAFYIDYKMNPAGFKARMEVAKKAVLK